MNGTHHTDARIRARDAALRTLNRLTTGAAIAAVAGVGVLAAVSAATIPGKSPSSIAQAAATTTGAASSSTSSSSASTSASSSSGLGSSSGVNAASSGSAVVVTGGS